MKTFDQALLEQLQRKGEHKTRRSSRLINLLEAPRTKRRKRRIERLERDVREHLEEQGITVGDDWGELEERDWEGFFEKLLQFILKILPAILLLF